MYFETLNKLSRLWQILAASRTRCILLLGVMLAAAVLETLSLSLTMPILGVLLEGRPMQGALPYLTPALNLFPQLQPLYLLLGLIVALTVLKSGVEVLKTYWSSELAWRLYQVWTDIIVEAYLYSPYAWITNQKQGTLITNSNEPGQAAKAIISILNFVTTTMLCFVLYLSLWFVHWQGTLVLTALGGVFLFFSRNSSDLSRKAGQERLDAFRLQNSYVAENILALRLIKTYGLQEKLLSRVKKVTHQVYKVCVRFETIKGAVSPISEVFLNVALAIFIIVVEVRTQGNFKSILPTLAFVLLVVRRLSRYVPSLVVQWMGIRFAISSIGVVENLIREAPKESGFDAEGQFDALTSDIQFQSVNFGYERGRQVLNDFNLTLKRGKMTALVGPSGSGKSTVADLLLGLIQPNSGAILINGKALSTYSLRSWRARIGYVSQETILVNGSILENISLGSPHASEADVIVAAQRAALHDFIVALPKGYRTAVGDRGVKLSGGQRQRIAIARALLRKPELFIFDEATSALDQETEQSVQEAIESIAVDKTVLVIAHRLTTIAKADFVVDFKSHL